MVFFLKNCHLDDVQKDRIVIISLFCMYVKKM